MNLKNLALPSALLSASAEPGFIEETHLRRHVPVVTGYSVTRGSGDFTGLHWGVLVRMDRQAILSPIHSFLLGLGSIGALVFGPLIGFLMWTTSRLRRAEDRHRLLIQSTAEGIYGMDLRGRCTFINSAGAHMLQYESREILGEPMHPLVHHSRPDGSAYPVEDCPIYQAFRSGRGCHIEDEVLWRQDGTCFPAAYSSIAIVDEGKIAGAVISFTDITDRKRMEEQLRQSEKLAALGTLIDGVSHELNNPLFMISGHAQLAKELLLQDKNENVMKNLQSIEGASRQMSVIVKRFVAVGRPEAGVIRACDLNAIMQETLELLKNDFLRHQIEVVWNSRKDLPKITANPQEIAQVFLNLLTNARQALGRMECKRCVYVTSDLKVANGADLLEIRITDNGPGIPSGALSRIFEPFYTSRSEGTGAGLGSSFCHRIISSVHGTIEAGSEGGHGASFVIRIPTCQ